MPKNNTHSFKNHFLIAMPSMSDPAFAHTLTYLCEHNEDGAMGIVVNQPLDISLGEIFTHLEITDTTAPHDDRPVMYGGPVAAERGFVLHSSSHSWQSTEQIAEGIYLSTSQDILEAIAHNSGPEKHLVALGYAGWGPDQLDQELAENAWLTVMATPKVLFSTPYEQRWEAAGKLLGVDLSLVSSDAGHA